jgi:hypothetical protein
MVNLEKERRFLIEIPIPWYAKFIVLKKSNSSRIYQTYLTTINNNYAERVRASIIGSVGVPIYTRTTKKRISSGINE